MLFPSDEELLVSVSSTSRSQPAKPAEHEQRVGCNGCRGVGSIGRETLLRVPWISLHSSSGGDSEVRMFLIMLLSSLSHDSLVYWCARGVSVGRVVVECDDSVYLNFHAHRECMFSMRVGVYRFGWCIGEKRSLGHVSVFIFTIQYIVIFQSILIVFFPWSRCRGDQSQGEVSCTLQHLVCRVPVVRPRSSAVVFRHTAAFILLLCTPCIP